MKILVRNGSSRKGNTFKLSKCIEKHMIALDDSITFEYIHLFKYNLKMCLGCHKCLFKGNDKCPIKDDRFDLIEKMENSDAFIFLSPVYEWSVSGYYKNFLDRLTAFNHRPHFVGKWALCLSTNSVSGLSSTLKYMDKAAKAWGLSTVKYGIMTPPTLVEKFIKRNEKKTYRVAKKFFENIHKPFKPTLSMIFNFEMSKALYSKGISAQVSPADHNFYSNRDFYIPVKISFFKRMLFKVIAKLISLIATKYISSVK